jgi:hypothetical protein
VLTTFVDISSTKLEADIDGATREIESTKQEFEEKITQFRAKMVDQQKFLNSLDEAKGNPVWN